MDLNHQSAGGKETRNVPRSQVFSLGVAEFTTRCVSWKDDELLRQLGNANWPIISRTHCFMSLLAKLGFFSSNMYIDINEYT